jgi:hypothetical protein
VVGGFSVKLVAAVALTMSLPGLFLGGKAGAACCCFTIFIAVVVLCSRRKS